jgi:O-antigen ligase
VARPRLGLRSAATAGLALLLVLPFGLTDGGYYGRSYLELSLALAALSGIAVVTESAGRLSRSVVGMAGALGLLAGWVALSARWAEDAAGVALETRRCLLYAIGLLAVSLVVDRIRRRVLVLALMGALLAITLVGLWHRAVSGSAVDPFYGTLLSEPVGYPNAMGALTAIGAVIGLGLSSVTSERSARALRGAACVFVLALGLTGSRGGALAFGLGLVVLLTLAPRAGRWSLVGSAGSAVAIGGAACAVSAATGSAGILLAVTLVAAAAGAAVPGLGCRGACGVIAALVCAGTFVVVAQPPPTGSSLRTAYWRAAAAELRERPLLGSGAGTFHRTWREHRTVPAEVRDAHSLYIETLSELGPLGLALVLAVVAIPLAAAVRSRGDPLVASAAAAFAVFAVHAGLDWDWELPIVTLTALGCAGAVLVTEPSVTTRRRER